MVLVGIGLILLAFVAVFLPPVQNYAKHVVANKIEATFGLPTEIGSIVYFPFTTLKISDIKMSDRSGSEFISIDEIKTDIGIMTFIDNYLNLKFLSVNSLTIHVRADADGRLNISNLAGDGQSPAPHPNISIDLLNITNSQLLYSTDKQNITLSDLNIYLRNLNSDRDHTSAKITGLSFNDDSNNRIFNILSTLNYQNDTLRFDDMEAAYGSSTASVSSIVCALSGDTLKNASLGINSLSLSDKELQLFGLPENTINTAINLSGRIEATKDRIEGSNLIFSTAENTSLSANFGVKNFSDRKNTKFKFEIIDLRTNLNDIKRIANADVASPNTAKSVGDIMLKGLFKGTLTDAKFDGSLRSLLGEIETHSHITAKGDSSYIVDGNIDAPTLNLASLTDGTVSELHFAADYDGRIDNNKLTFSHLKGKSNKLTFKGYAYRDVVLDAMMQNNDLYGVMDITDPNGSVTAVGEYTRNDGKPRLSLTAKVDSLRTGVTNLTPSIPQGNLCASLRSDFTGDNLDNITGNIWLGDLLFKGKPKDVVEKAINIDIVEKNENEKSVIVNSDNLKVNALGSFRLDMMIAEIKNQLAAASDIVFSPAKMAITDDRTVDFDIEYKDIEQYLQFVSDNILVEENGRISGHIESTNHTTNIVAQLGNVFYNQSKLSDTQLTVDFGNNTLAACITAQTIEIPNVGQGENLNICNSLCNNRLSSTSQWRSRQSDDAFSAIALNAILTDNNGSANALINVEPTEMLIGGDVWSIVKSTINVNDKRIDIKDFIVKHDDKYLAADGSIDKNSTADTLTITMNQLTLDNILPPDPDRKVDIAGDMSAKIRLTSQQGKLRALLDADVDRFHVNRDYLEHLDIVSDWQPEEERLNLDLAIVSGNKCRARAIGGLDNAKNLFDLKFDIDSLSDGFLNFYLGTPIKDIKGSTSGKLRLYGALPDLKIDAQLCVHRTEFTVRQSLVKYVFDHNDSLFIAPNYIEFCNLQFSDPNGRKGNFYGHISHKMFSGLRLFLNFDFNDQLVLQTTEKDNSTYYGTLYANGQLRVNGTPASPELNITASTASKSEFFIQPLEKNDLAELDHIKFRSRNDSTELIVSKKDILDGVSALLNINILPTAKIHAILNPRTQNKITANGNGSLRLRVDKSGDLSIYGNYVIEKGTYNFSFENIVNKQFVINDGGTITWAGDPYNANVDLTATYKVKAALADLVANDPNANLSELRRRVPINCNILLSNKLMDPNIKFKIEIPSTNNFNQYTFDQYVNTEEEVNKQAFSLLLSNRFYAVQNSSTAAAGQAFIGNTASELLSSQLSNQISNWMSQNKYNIGVGVNYRPGDEISNEEYELALSTQMLDNKIILSGNVGYGRNTTPDQKSDGNFIGDFDLEVKLNKKGNIRAKAYTHTNNDILYDTSPTTQGIGISFNEEFNNFGDVLRKYWRIVTGKRKREKKE